MKIGILTQPLHTNYGGLLQAFALQSVLKKMGHEVLTIDRDKKVSLYLRVLSIIKRLTICILKCHPTIIRVWPTAKEQNIIAKNTNRFINENIRTTKKFYSTSECLRLKQNGFEAYIVGSDQVWRPIYSPCLTNYFLDFLGKDDKTKRIAYAASFGVDSWEFSTEQTAQAALLVKKFDAISVREDSAQHLCKKYFGMDAEFVLDPTLLLTKKDYKILVDKDNIPKSKGTLMTYVLDKSLEKKEIIQKVATELNIIPFTVMPKNSFQEVGKKNIKNCIYPPVTEWIRGFMDAEYVVTDSFHGTVFSIIFNKPFISIGNLDRGMTRFTSLLKMFGLEERIILSKEELTVEKIHKPINFQPINKIIKYRQQQSFSFLYKLLNN